MDLVLDGMESSLISGFLVVRAIGGQGPNRGGAPDPVVGRAHALGGLSVGGEPPGPGVQSRRLHQLQCVVSRRTEAKALGVFPRACVRLQLVSPSRRLLKSLTAPLHDSQRIPRKGAQGCDERDQGEAA